jgi:hypothetical protein
MKKLILPALMMLSCVAFAQSAVKNGTIYKEHPYITAVKNLNADFAKGDTLAVAAFYADTAKFIDSPEPKKEYGLKQASSGWHELLSDWTIVTIKQVGYPDGLEYATDPFTVQSWWEITIINKKTQKKAFFEEVVFDTFNKDGKISFEVSYYDATTVIAAMK